MKHVKTFEEFQNEQTGSIEEGSGPDMGIKAFVNKGFEKPEERLDKIESLMKEKNGEEIALSLVYYWTQKGKISKYNEFEKLIKTII